MTKKQLSILFFTEKIRLSFSKNSEKVISNSLEKCFAAYESVVDRKCKKFVSKNKLTFDRINKFLLSTQKNSNLFENEDCKGTSILASKRINQAKAQKLRDHQIEVNRLAEAKADLETNIKILELDVDELYKYSLSKAYKLIGKYEYKKENPFSNEPNVRALLIELGGNDYELV